MPLFILFIAVIAQAQQVADTSFNPPVAKPAYAQGAGPVILLDEAHHNFHTMSGRYGAFARLLIRDGYTVRPNTAAFTKDALHAARVLVIANAVHEKNRDDWTPPNPSAFTDAEIKGLMDWIRGGASLLLIADHMPFAGAASALGSALGITFTNGYVRAPNRQAPGADVFTRASGALQDHAITKGVDSVATFTGSAFRATGKVDPILRLGAGFLSLTPERPGDLTKIVERTPVDGWLQGAVWTLGRGRVAVFGEAAMFSAQVTGPNRTPMGMNHPQATHNAQFLLNLMHWLSDVR